MENIWRSDPRNDSLGGAQVLKTIDEKTALLPGVSPGGYVYRLSAAFDRYPKAVLGRTAMVLSTIGKKKFSLDTIVPLGYLPTLHWYSPNFSLHWYSLHWYSHNLVNPRMESHELVIHPHGR